MIEDETDFDDIFDGEAGAEIAPAPEIDTPAEIEAASDTPAEIEEVPQAEQPTDDAPAPEDGSEPVAPEPVESGTIPAHVLKSMREDHKAQQAELRAEIERLRAQPQPTAQPAPEPETPARPDPVLDPDGYHDYIMAEAQQRVSDNILKSNMDRGYQQAIAGGRDKAELDKIGNAFIAAAQSDPKLIQGMKSAHDPIAYIDDWNRRETVNTELAAHGYDVDKLIAAHMAAQQSQTNVAAPAAPTPQSPAPKIPQSLVDTRPATAVPGVSLASDEIDFDAVFS